MATCRAKPLTTGNIRRRLAAVHKVLWSTVLQTPTYVTSNLDWIVDTLRNIQPMELAVQQMCQAAVELVRSADYVYDFMINTGWAKESDHF